MKFSIITPTYKRGEKLTRAIQSVLAQTHADWELIIINDSPGDASYRDVVSSIQDPRICYYINDKNSGVNFSRNRGLDALSADSRWVIFLDDDDYLAPDALATFRNLINTHQGSQWFITNRAYKDGKPLTSFPLSDKTYSYAWDYLIFKKGKGDATHCIKTELLHHVRFSKTVKQGEEWFFFYQVGLKEKLYYHDHNSTITEGYDAQAGLNFRKRTKKELFLTVTSLFYEGLYEYHLYYFSFLLYVSLRFIKILVR